MAVANYHDANGRYPPQHVAGPDGRPWHSWRVLILPYLDHGDVYDAYDFGEPWDGPHNRTLAERMPSLYAFHGWDQPGNTTTNYLVVVGDETAWPGSQSVTSADVTDGLHATIMLVENDGAGVHWMEPRDLLLKDMDLRLNAPAGVSSPYDEPAVATLDGQLHRLRAELQPETLRALFTTRGGEPLEPDAAVGWELLKDGRVRPFNASGAGPQ